MKTVNFFILTIISLLLITSCTNHDFETLSESEIIKSKYEASFVKRFGNPSPDQTWGFGNNLMTRAVDPNNNLWFDENQMNYKKPADITEAERDYVMNWFATHGKQDGTTFDYNDYFLQNVGYSGKTYDVEGNYYEKTENGVDIYRKENYSVNSKNYMDLICANLNEDGSNHDVIYNFNVNSGNIQLLLNSETKYGFGFEDSWGDDFKHVTDNYLLAVIDVPGIGVGYYVGLDYQTRKLGYKNNGESYDYIYLKPDGVYDDRVMKIVPAEKNIPSVDIRVIAEDLTVSESGDFDFNDVVFDVIIDYPKGKTTIILQAAGGTLPLTVAGKEVHELFGVLTTTMVNTGEVSKEPVSFEVDLVSPINIPVYVQKGTDWIELTAIQGKVPGKIGVDITYDWCKERQDIESKYPLFKEYVKAPSTKWY